MGAGRWAVAAVLGLSAYVVLPAGARTGIVVALTAASGVAFVVVTARRRLWRSAWAGIAVAYVMATVADLVYFLVVGDGLPDVIWFASYLPLIVGLWSLVRRTAPGNRLEDLLDAGVISAAATVVITYLIATAPADVSLWEAARQHTYTGLDIVVAAAVLRLLRRGGRHVPAMRWLAAGAVGMLVADTLYAHLDVAGHYVVGGLFDLAWPAAYLAILLALHHARPDDAVGPDETRTTHSRLMVVLVALLALMVTGVPIEDAAGEAWATSAAAIAVVCIGARMWLMHASWMRAEEQVSTVLQRAHDPYVAVDLEGVVHAWNAAAERTFGHRAEDAIGAHLEELVVPATGRGPYRAWLAHLRAGITTTSARPTVVEAMNAAGDLLTVEVALWEVGTGQSRRLHAYLRDVTAREHAAEQLRRQALHDPLTGLSNRVLLSDRVEVALASARRTGAIVAVVLLDLDDFKEINDTRGHQAGDALLLDVAGRLQQGVRASDTVARYGGDEFAIVATIAAGDDAERVAATALEALDRGDPPIRVSAGVATSDDAASVTEVFACADLALYEAKRRGKGRVGRYDAELHAATQRRNRLRADLEDAITSGALSVAYQPIVETDSGAITGAEALARWTHPDFGPVRPDEFIGIAEETGLIGQLGDAVLRRACADAASWPAGPRGPLTVSVNVSARQFGPRLAASVAGALVRAGLAADRLVLELTETTLIESVDRVAATMAQLRRTGIRFAIDDFGTGFASLSTLADLPVDAIKVDRQFVAMCTGDVHQHALAHAAVRLGQALGLSVIAEGVETLEQQAQLLEWGCPHAQGYLFGRPMGSDALVTRLAGTSAASVTAS